MAKFQDHLYNIGYPISGAKFLNQNTLLVAGGGGNRAKLLGNPGDYPNKITALRIDSNKKKVVKRFREITLDPNDDSPSTLDAANNIILVGCNESYNKIQLNNGENHHIRKFLYEDEHLKFSAAIDFERSSNPQIFTKIISLSANASIGAIASSQLPTTIKIIDPINSVEKYEIQTGRDVKDINVSNDGTLVSYVTERSLEIVSVVNGQFVVRKNDFNENELLSKIEFINNSALLLVSIAQSVPTVTNLRKLSLNNNKVTVLDTIQVPTKTGGVTSMDIEKKTGKILALSTADNSIILVDLEHFKIIKTFDNVHDLTISKVIFSPDTQFLASVSVANTVHVIKLPTNIKSLTSTSIFSKLWSFFINVILVVIIAIIAQISYKNDLHWKIATLLKHKYLDIRERLSSDNDNDVLVSTIFDDDMVTISTITKPLDTETKSIKTIEFTSLTTTEDDVWATSESSSGTDSIPPIYSTLSHYDEIVSSHSVIEPMSSHEPSSILSAIEEGIPIVTQMDSKVTSATPSTFPAVEESVSASDILSVRELKQDTNIESAMGSRSSQESKIVQLVTVDSIVYEVISMKPVSSIKPSTNIKSHIPSVNADSTSLKSEKAILSTPLSLSSASPVEGSTSPKSSSFSQSEATISTTIELEETQPVAIESDVPLLPTALSTNSLDKMAMSIVRTESPVLTKSSPEVAFVDETLAERNNDDTTTPSPSSDYDSQTHSTQIYTEVSSDESPSFTSAWTSEIHSQTLLTSSSVEPTAVWGDLASASDSSETEAIAHTTLVEETLSAEHTSVSVSSVATLSTTFDASVSDDITSSTTSPEKSVPTEGNNYASKEGSISHTQSEPEHLVQAVFHGDDTGITSSNVVIVDTFSVSSYSNPSKGFDLNILDLSEEQISEPHEPVTSSHSAASDYSLTTGTAVSDIASTTTLVDEVLYESSSESVDIEQEVEKHTLNATSSATLEGSNNLHTRSVLADIVKHENDSLETASSFSSAFSTEDTTPVQATVETMEIDLTTSLSSSSVSGEEDNTLTDSLASTNTGLYSSSYTPVASEEQDPISSGPTYANSYVPEVNSSGKISLEEETIQWDSLNGAIVTTTESDYYTSISIEADLQPTPIYVDHDEL
ncbi:hypothetical protein KAFR_0F02820 [Kazachstania africana CBS 2517]|uniref:Guanine nucleotide-exchange factor SEC12 n=1 Tax=Kazachstania africana (strain ATCC 22294 / BCRC 22015 / CBS 2517 / CECT 1963 / NBRC 1671 / NRRL Y-8276) TaxID=1071382 RepID=H2AWX9_KAZAF|nr:hypothetical protein KAFR_0F02820 [Kazachstania africana CBS 2517]CCF58879.1 hypothetical protein KAFR_0F02820 [Kazachstania africana CBS 2517]